MTSPDTRGLLTEILTEQAGQYTPYVPIPALKNRDVTLKEKIANYLRDKAFGGGRSGQRQANKIMDFADFTPLSAFYNAPQEFMNIQSASTLKGGLLPSGLLALELSGAGKPVKEGGKVVKGLLGKKTKPLTVDKIDPTGEYFKVKGTKTKPLSETKIDLKKDYDLIPEKKINIEDLQGKTLFPLMGDQSATGLLLGGIDDVKFKPVKLEGGANFMRGKAQQDEGAIWASGKGVISDITNRINKIAEKTGEAPDLIYSAMKKDAIDFATFPAKALAQQLKSAKILKKDMKAFDKIMKSNVGKPDKKGKYEFSAVKDWVGVDSPDLVKYLDNAGAEVRKKFVKMMDTAPFQMAGFPDVGKTRYAITEPSLRNIKAGSTGAVIARPDLNKAPSPSKHSTYDTQIYGDYVGGLLDQVPRNVMFKDFYKALDNRKTSTGKPLNDAMKDYIFRLSLPTQKVDQELVDIISNLGLLRSK